MFLALGLLESNQNLLFMLKCRQFVEMVNGSDLDVSCFKQFFSHVIKAVSPTGINSSVRYTVDKK
jgi:hypothetical protein